MLLLRFPNPLMPKVIYKKLDKFLYALIDLVWI